jgi:membrane-associated phospholipid phosphatase
VVDVMQVRGASAWDRWNEQEAVPVRRWLPATAPSSALTLLSAAAEGGGLWVALGAVLACWPGRLRRSARDGVVAVGVASGSAHLLGLVASRPRPPGRQLAAYQALVRKPHSPSLPSAHTAIATAFTVAVGRRVAAAGWGLAPLAAAVAYSRVRTRAHWPTDVVAGAVHGAVVGEAVHRLMATLT